MKRLLPLLLPVALWSAMSCAAPQNAPVKNAPVASISHITLSQGWSQGGGEEFELTLRSDGTATLKKKDWMLSEATIPGGTFSGKIARSRFDKLADLVRKVNFFTLKHRYDNPNIFDAGTTVIDAAGQGKTWRVSSYANSAPPAFLKVAQALRAERAFIRWTTIESSKKQVSKTAQKSGYEWPLTREEIRIKAGDMGTCELHHVPLREGMAPISYGQPVEIVRGIFEARRALFPHAKTEIIGGCIVSEDSPQTRIVAFCPQCREAEATWIATHRSTRKTRKSKTQ